MRTPLKSHIAPKAHSHRALLKKDKAGFGLSIWFECNGDVRNNKKYRGIGRETGNHNNYTIFGYHGKHITRPHYTYPKGIVIRWGKGNFIGILYKSNKAWTREETPKI